MRICVIADTHFYDDSMVTKFKIRAPNFEEKIVKLWNLNVTEDDMVIHLGDVSFSDLKDWTKIISRLKGRKVLCRGNHDKKSISWYMKNGFDFCCDEFYINMYGYRILFSHEPKYFDSGFNLNIHGHLHNKTFKEYKCDKRHFLISLENNGYHPRLLSTIISDWEWQQKKDLDGRKSG